MALNDMLDQMDLTDTYRMFNPKAIKYTFFPKCTQDISKKDHILGYRTSLHKFKKTEIIRNIFSNHNAIKVQVNYKKKTKKFTNMWGLSSMLLNN